MAALAIDVEKDALFVENYDDLEWVSDVTEYECTRCGKILLQQHFVANCKHKFCANCERLFHDKSQKWRCTKCHELITKIVDERDPKFDDKVMQLQLHCPNKKYGCKHICTLKEVKKHIEGCGRTKEKALPVFYNSNFTFEMLELRSEMKEMKRKMMEMEKRNCNSDENVWNLSVEVNEMKLEMEKKQNDGEEKLSSINCRVNRVESDFKEETSGLKSVWSVLEEHKSGLLKLETATNTWCEIVEFNKWKSNELTHQLKYELEKELKTAEIEMKSEMEKLERTMNEIVVSREKKWAETKERVVRALKDEKERREKMTSNLDKNTLQLLSVSAQTDSLNRDLQNQVLKPLSNFQKRLESVCLSLDEMRKMIVAQERKVEEVESQISEFKKEKKKCDDQSSFNSAGSLPQLYKTGREYYYKVKPNFTWKVKGIENLENGSQKELLSQEFRVKGYPFGAQAKITLYANSFQFYLSYKDVDKSNRQIEIQPIPNIYLTLKDRSVNGEEEKRDVIGTHYFTYYKEKLEYNTFYPLYLRNVDRRTLNSPTYNVNDEVVLDIHVENPEVAQLVYSCDGTLTWALDDYRKRKQLAEDGLIVSYLSPYFYTHSDGYRVRVRVYLNGYDEYESKGLTIAFALLTGIYDDLLDEVFPHKTTITVFDPTQPARNISKSVEKDTRNCHWINVGSHEEIEKLLYYDTLYYKVKVDRSS